MSVSRLPPFETPRHIRKPDAARPTIPKAPRLASRRSLEEVRKIARIVAIGNPFGRRLGLAGIERPAGHQPRLVRFIVGHARPPAFRRLADEIAVLGQRLAVCLEFRREKADVIARRFELPRIAARQQARPRRSALGVRRVGLCEQQPFAGHAVESGRIDPFAAVGAGMAESPVVGDRQQDVGPITICGLIVGNGRRGGYTDRQASARIQKSAHRCALSLECFRNQSRSRHCTKDSRTRFTLLSSWRFPCVASG